MKALILAAGYGTRLYPLTKTYPKALLKVGRKAIIDYIIDKLFAIREINEIIVVTNSRFFSYFKEWAAILAIRCRKPLYSIGPICFFGFLKVSISTSSTLSKYLGRIWEWNLPAILIFSSDSLTHSLRFRFLKASLTSFIAI